MPRRFSGFTLIELLVTLVILALLATAATPMMQLTTKRSKEQELRRALWQIRDAIDEYKQASDDGLISLSKERSGYPSSLLELVRGVENSKDSKHRRIIFLRRIPRDPFYPDPNVPPDKTWGKRSYRGSFQERSSINERGSDDADDVYDVYSLSSGVGLNGVPYREW